MPQISQHTLDRREVHNAALACEQSKFTTMADTEKSINALTH